MLCAHCGTAISSECNFCPNCGNKIKSDPNQPLVPLANANPTAKRTVPLWFKAIIALAAIGIMWSFLAVIMREDATDIVEEQLQTLKEGHITQAYYNFTSKDFREATSLEQFSDFVKKHSEFIKNSSVAFTERNIDNNEGSLEAIISSSNDTKINVLFQVLKEDNTWKILSIQIENPTNNPPSSTLSLAPNTLSTQNDSLQKEPPKATVEDSPLLTPIIQQLTSLKKGDISSSYDDVVSQKFAESTSKADFEKYIESHPIFSHYSKVSYSEIQQQEHLGSVKATLTSTHETATIDYELIEEDNSWKIWSLRLEESDPTDNTSSTTDDNTPSESDIDSSISKPLYETITKLLEKIQQHDFQTAYNDYTSEEFKKSTTLEQFEAFATGQPPLKHYKNAKFSKLSFDNNIATISGILQSQEGLNYPTEYNLIFEDNLWKILHLQIAPPSKTTSSSSTETPQTPENSSKLQFSKFLLGTITDAHGIVQNPEKVFKSDSGDLYLNLYIENGSPGIKIEVQFSHTQSASKLPPLTATLSGEGETMLSFVFSPPKNGWPKGSYSIQAKSSSGTLETFNFEIN